jgi:hypothetical protein
LTDDTRKADNNSHKQRGGAVKKAPPGYYTASEAARKLGWNIYTFRYYVRAGKIKRYVPPMRKEGFYNKKEIDRLASETALFLHTLEEKDTTEVRIAQPQDAQGIVEVLTIRGWQTATAEQRISWYAINPLIDLVAITDEKVSGYIHAVPYIPETLSDMMAVRKRAWHIEADEIVPYEPGNTYDLYVGIATVESIPNHTQRVGFRLMSEFLSFLEELAERHIYIRRLYAVSAEESGQKLCQKLGFMKQEDIPEDYLFPDWHRYILDLETSKSRFAQQYREAVQRTKE